MFLEILLLSAALACPPDDAVAVSDSSVSVTEDPEHKPKLLDPEFHAKVHREHGSVKDGAIEVLSCGATPTYRETVWFTSAAHTSVSGYRFEYCNGSYVQNGTPTVFCDKYEECCAPPYPNEVSTCE